MSLKDRIQGDLLEAMRAHDTERATALRGIKAAIRNAEIDQQVELDDQGVTAVVTQVAKQRRDSIEAYRQGGRPDLVAAEEAELHIIEVYLPKQLSEEEIRTAVNEAIAELGAKGPADMGRVMKQLTTQLRGQVDGRVLSTMVREALAGSGK